MTPCLRAAVVAVALAGGTGVAALGQSPAPAGNPEVVPTVWIFSSGTGGSGTSSSASLVDGAWHEVLLWSGSATGPDLCTVGLASPLPGRAEMPAWAGRPIVTWRLAFRRQAFDGFTATIEVRWRRDSEAGAGIEPAGTFERTFVWRAAEGDARVLDLVRQIPAGRPDCDAQSITIEYRAIGPEGLREAAIGYDVWLVQRLPSGDAHTRRLEASGRQDDVVRFAFPAVGIDAPGLTGPEPRMVDVSVEGRIRGRVRRDGRLDLAVDAGRIVRPRGRGLGGGSSGRTHLTVAPGETVELEPPPLHGSSPYGDFATALKDAPTAIRVRARRLW